MSTQKAKEARKKDLDYILDDVVGGNGFWQWRTTFMLLPLAWVGGDYHGNCKIFCDRQHILCKI